MHTPQNQIPSCSNHGTYFYNQLASLQILVGDTNGATNTIKQYFSQQYMGQIDASGEQVSVRSL